MRDFEDAETSKMQTSRWTRIGSAGESKTKTFDRAAATAVAVLIEEKMHEGYVECSH